MLKKSSPLKVHQRSYSQVGHIPPKMSDKFESQHSLSPTIWSDIVVGRESGYLKIFFYISRGEHVILWSMRICKRTFFPVCRMSGYVNLYPSVFLLCTIFVPGRVAQRSIYNWNIIENWRLNTHSLI
jgi:hypothetical protein